ncbi:MAG: hypothetical protein M3Q32_02320, partial [Pseudomonadota bacterium]|nr:hypothetical protein [Pseudomonadota bacterium]
MHEPSDCAAGSTNSCSSARETKEFRNEKRLRNKVTGCRMFARSGQLCRLRTAAGPDDAGNGVDGSPSRRMAEMCEMMMQQEMAFAPFMMTGLA